MHCADPTHVLRWLKPMAARVARQVHAFPTSWYRIHPSMFTDAHETLQELHPSDFVTPLDTALRDFIRFRDGRGAYPARWEDPL